MIELYERNDLFYVALTAAELAAYQQPKPSPTAVTAVVLDVPHLSQYGKDADARRRDCGGGVAVVWSMA